MNNYYDVGDLVVLTGTFTTTAGAAVDPTTVTLTIKNPAGTLVTKTYAAGDLIKTATGVYTYDLPIDKEGQWWYRFVGTGAAVAATEQSFLVNHQRTK